jgi:hypothetical protein
MSSSSLLLAPLLLEQLNHVCSLRRPRWRRAPAPSPTRQARPPPCWWCAPPLLLWILVGRPSLATVVLPSLPRVGPASPLLTPASRRAGGALPAPALRPAGGAPASHRRIAEAAPWGGHGGALAMYGMSAAGKTVPLTPEGALRPCSLPLHSDGPTAGAKIPTSSTAGKR